MRRGVLVAAAACLLAGPTVLAFFSGGFFAEPRLIAAIITWALVLALAVSGDPPLPRSLPGALALGGLAFITVWSAVSIAWAPLGGPAVETVQRLVLYTGALAVAGSVLRAASATRAVEPALAAGATIVIGYGLAGRLLPGLIELARSERAGGRLEQPITYWNAEGLLAAVGLVLCARLAGDPSRPRAVRVLAAAAAAPLGAGVYLSYSRGAIAAALAGLLVLVAVAPSTAQLRSAVLALAAGAAGAAVTAAFPYVAALEGESPERDGALALVGLLVIAASAAALSLRLGPDESPGGAPPRWAPRLPAVAAVAVAAALVGLLAAGLGERPTEAELGAGAGAGRLTTASSNRYEYWRVALNAFAREPLTGIGAGGFRVEWLRERRVREAVRDAHSLPVETAAELGLPGLLGLAALVVGVALAARRALARHRALAAGATAALTTWFLHACIDWDWEVPAVTMPAIVLAGVLTALSERRADPAAAGPPTPAARTPDPARA
jgi:hypothetical protein